MITARTQSRYFFVAGFLLLLVGAFHVIARFFEEEDVELQCLDAGPSPAGAYSLCGFSGIELMHKMASPRPLFTFTLTPWNVKCDGRRVKSNPGTRWSMIVGIKSHSGHFKERASLRETWKPYRFYNGIQLEFVFVVGAAEDWNANSKLIEENKKHGDLLMIDKKETYTEVGLKALAAMQWVGDHCPSHWIYASCDDDMGPNFPRLFKRIESLMHHDYSLANLETTPIECGYSYRQKEIPIRDRRWKNYVLAADYPLGLVYPPFCAGGFYSMSVKLSSAIYRASREHLYFFNDDVWITGLLRLAAIDAGEFPCDDVTDLYCAIVPTDFRDVRHLSVFRNRIMYHIEHWSDRIRGVL